MREGYVKGWWGNVRGVRERNVLQCSPFLRCPGQRDVLVHVRLSLFRRLPAGQRHT